MILTPIDPDPQPSEEDLAPFLVGRKLLDDRRDIERTLAAMQWRLDRRAADPDAFLVAFSTDAFPALGFRSYAQYRASDLWAGIRREELRKAGGRCAACGAPTCTIHHRDYRPRVLRGDDRRPLFALCQPCHEQVHFSGPKQERSWNESEEILSRLIAEASA